MNLLLDTHVLLWWLDDNPTISRLAYSSIATGKNIVFYSAVTIWEIRIKETLGKLKIPDNFEEVLKKQSFESLDVTVEHAHSIRSLPDIHTDPFDRLLIAQTKFEKMTLVTRDTNIKKYGISFIDA